MTQVHQFRTYKVYGLKNKTTGQFRRGAFLDFYKKFDTEGVDTEEIKYSLFDKELYHMKRLVSQNQELRDNYEVVAIEMHVEEHWNFRAVNSEDR